MKNLENILQQNLRLTVVKKEKDTQTSWGEDDSYKFVNPLYQGDKDLNRWLEVEIEKDFQEGRHQTFDYKKSKFLNIRYGSLDIEDSARERKETKYPKRKRPDDVNRMIEKEKYGRLTSEL